MDSPSPVPSPAGLVVKNGLNILSFTSGGRHRERRGGPGLARQPNRARARSEGAAPVHSRWSEGALEGGARHIRSPNADPALPGAGHDPSRDTKREAPARCFDGSAMGGGRYAGGEGRFPEIESLPAFRRALAEHHSR